MTNAPHTTYEELIAAYAIDALDEGERRRAEADLLFHIAACETCRRLFNDLRTVGADIGLSVEPVPLPPGLEQRVMRAVHDEQPAARPLRARPPLWRQLIAAAAIMVFGLAGGMVLQTARSDGESRRVVALMSDPSVESATLVGKDGHGIVFVGRSGDGALLTKGMRNPPKGRVLKLWLMHDGTPVPSVAFRPSDRIVSLKVAPGDYDAAAITVEKDPDVQVPSVEPIYAGTLSRGA